MYLRSEICYVVVGIFILFYYYSIKKNNCYEMSTFQNRDLDK